MVFNASSEAAEKLHHEMGGWRSMAQCALSYIPSSRVHKKKIGQVRSAQILDFVRAVAVV